MDVSSEQRSQTCWGCSDPLYLKAFLSCSFWQGNFKDRFLERWSISDTGMQVTSHSTTTLPRPAQLGITAGVWHEFQTQSGSKTQRFTQLPSELSILTVLGKEEKDFTGLFDLIKYLENTVADLDVFQTELTMAAYKAVMLQLACISWTYDTLTTQTLRELASTHYTRGIYTMCMLDLHYSSHNFLKLITGLINWKKSSTLWDSSCMIFLKE